MDSRTVVNGFFQNIAPQLGFQVVIGDTNLCSITQKSTGDEYVIELPNNGDLLYLYAPLCDVPFDNREPLFEFLLQMNLHGIETMRNIIGLDRRMNKFVLSRVLKVEELNETSLLNTMNTFFSSLTSLKERITQFSQSQVQDSRGSYATGPVGAPNLNFII